MTGDSTSMYNMLEYGSRHVQHVHIQNKQRINVPTAELTKIRSMITVRVILLND